MKKIWLVEFPTYQYNENVVELAKQNGLKIIDSRYAKDYNQDQIATQTPTLTKIGEKVAVRPARTPKIED